MNTRIVRNLLEFITITGTCLMLSLTESCDGLTGILLKAIVLGFSFPLWKRAEQYGLVKKRSITPDMLAADPELADAARVVLERAK